MADLFENPMGLDGFEFVEFAAPEKGALEPILPVQRRRARSSSRRFTWARWKVSRPRPTAT